MRGCCPARVSPPAPVVNHAFAVGSVIGVASSQGLPLTGSVSDCGSACPSFGSRWRHLPFCESGRVVGRPCVEKVGPSTPGHLPKAGSLPARFTRGRSTPVCVFTGQGQHRCMAQGRVTTGAWHRVDDNGKWQMANGKWQMANGKWQMANGKWQMASGKWPIG